MNKAGFDCFKPACLDWKFAIQQCALGVTTELGSRLNVRVHADSDLIASHREPMVAMLRRQPILDRLFVQEAGHVVDLAFWTAVLDLPTSSGRLLSFENYMSVYHRARLHR